MATYKKNCIYCNNLIPGDATTCPFCAHSDPFVMRCPKCRNPVEKGWKVCSGCGIPLAVICCSCGKETPTGPKCVHCGGPVLVECPRRRCGTMQLLTAIDGKCIACGKPLLKK